MTDDEVDQTRGSPRFAYPAAPRGMSPSLQHSAWQYPQQYQAAGKPPQQHWPDYGPGSPSSAAGSFFMNANSMPSHAYGVNSMPRSDSVLMQAQFLHGGMAPQLNSFEDVAYDSSYHRASAQHQPSWEQHAPHRGRSWEHGHADIHRSGSQPLSGDRVFHALDNGRAALPEPAPTLPALQGLPQHDQGCATPGYGGAFYANQAYDPMMSTNHLPAVPVPFLPKSPMHSGRGMPVMSSRGGPPGFGELDVTKRRDDISDPRMFSARSPGQMATMTLPMVMMDD